ncbi:hypothetical protein JX266_004195 [Neoarthrinium moseri]|nr:hypothetical protein JX266_004195 [Neoarthrinium moseri]
MSMGMTGTATAAASATTSAMSMDMGMDMGGGASCKISMLWNWNTVDACFISKSWQITSSGMFAGSCIGVILLVMALEMLRRATKEYDGYLVRKHIASVGPASSGTSSPPTAATTTTTTTAGTKASPGSSVTDERGVPACVTSGDRGFRPSILEQAVRALLHTVQFAVAYFIMLLAMYYNGYFIICIFIGAYLGAFVFQWEVLGRGASTGATKEATVCCG